MTKVLIGMSGGVDSSVCAALLKKQGFEVTGATLSLWRDSGTADEDAARIANVLGIEYITLDCAQDFRREVVDYFTQEYLHGRTPNPCVRCNRVLKMRTLALEAKRRGIDFIATGHYARTERVNGRTLLKKAVHATKDQSYFLYDIGEEILNMLLMPLGGYSKDEIRAMAQQLNLPVAQKPDSQEICFLPDGDYASFIKKYAPSLPPRGDMLYQDGKPCGRHDGIYNYTIGQRKGLGAFGKPVFVRKINAENNTVTIGDDLFSSSLTTENFRNTSGEQIQFPLEVNVKIRSRAREAAAVITPHGNGVTAQFKEPQRAVTPGQSAVFYVGDAVIGGGVILSGEDNGNKPLAR